MTAPHLYRLGYTISAEMNLRNAHSFIPRNMSASPWKGSHLDPCVSDYRCSYTWAKLVPRHCYHPSIHPIRWPPFLPLYLPVYHHGPVSPPLKLSSSFLCQSNTRRRYRYTTTIQTFLLFILFGVMYYKSPTIFKF